VAHRRYKVVCELQTLAASGTTEKVIFKGRTLFLGQSSQEVRLDRLFWIDWAANHLHALILSYQAAPAKCQKL
jgi:hypothetical protein